MTTAAWPEVALGEVCEPITKRDPGRSGADRFTYVDLGSVDQRMKEITGASEVATAEAPSRARQVIAAGDVLVSTVRPNLNAVATVPSHLDGATASTGFAVLRPSAGQLETSFVAHWVQSPAFVTEMVRKATGASYPAVSDRIVKESMIPLPPIEEQRRIAAVLDRAHELGVARRRTADLLGNLVTAVFRETFGFGPYTPVTIGRDLDSHPEGWQWELLTDVARLATGHTPDREIPEYWDGEIPWISLTEIRELDGRIATGTRLRVSQAGIDSSSAVVLPEGTVCFSRTASLAFVTVMGYPMATSQDFVNWVCGDRLDPLYLMHALIRSRSRLRALSTGSTHKTIYMRVAEQFRVLVPPIELQRRFAERVTEIAEQQAALRRSADRLDELFASLQQRAFRGEL